MAFYIIAIFFVALDRLLKTLAVNGYFKFPIKIIDDLFKLSFTPNYNIAFSLPIRGISLDIAIIFLIIFLLWFFVRWFKKGETVRSAILFCVIVGAASNLLDRLRFGYVVDYLDLRYFTVFNLADCMIVGGGIGIIWLLTIKKEPSK